MQLRNIVQLMHQLTSGGSDAVCFSLCQFSNETTEIEIEN